MDSLEWYERWLMDNEEEQRYLSEIERERYESQVDYDDKEGGFSDVVE